MKWFNNDFSWDVFLISLLFAFAQMLGAFIVCLSLYGLFFVFNWVGVVLTLAFVVVVGVNYHLINKDWR